MAKFSGKRVLISATALLVVSIWWNFSGRIRRLPPAEPPLAPPVVTKRAEDKSLKEAPLVSSMAKRLEIPWALAFLPDRNIIFTERPGRVRLIDSKQGLQEQPLLSIAEVAPAGEGGLLGLAVHPDFSKNRFIYLYYTYRAKGKLANKVVRYRINGKTLGDPKIILDRIPGESIHDGGRIKFGPEGLLYITTGDAAQPELAQNKNSLAGKILRVTDEGEIPADNPFPDSPVYSFGHRNPQGLAWDDRERLWATEHGQNATDEVNLIEPGKNYGWSLIRGEEKAPGMESPIIQSGQETWAPSGAAFSKESLYFVGLRGQTLFELVTRGTGVTLRRHLERKLGRLRDVVAGPDGFLYILTNNRDGRGFPISDDDQIIRVNPRKL